MTGSTDGVIARSKAHLVRLWEQDRAAFGVWSSTRDAAVAELMAASPFDYVCVDLQHGHATYADLPGMLQAMRAAGRAPLARVPWNDPASIMRALDVGTCGVIVPMVDSAVEAAAAAAACRYPPHGSRSWGPMWASVRDDGAPGPREQDAAVLCLVMVETRAAVDALDEIVRVPGVDGVYIGPNDLALGCGFDRATYRDSPAVDALIEGIVTTCREAGVVVGLHCSDAEMAAHWAGRGVRLLTVGQDLALLHGAVARQWAALDQATGRAE
ncbi:HpcH/HpaI aldolase family protein [Pseudonocardia lacus]|uniref:HpcH/HpaI aldolase family protein n=1 Tax=Pseudonocardia lacus TaxID=2835865 RepID=UPI001BDCE62F|nr:aldolase/citrate lyase family protein [Pseudonocardia lacus]